MNAIQGAHVKNENKQINKQTDQTNENPKNSPCPCLKKKKRKEKKRNKHKSNPLTCGTIVIEAYAIKTRGSVKNSEKVISYNKVKYSNYIDLV